MFEAGTGVGRGLGMAVALRGVSTLIYMGYDMSRLSEIGWVEMDRATNRCAIRTVAPWNIPWKILWTACDLRCRRAWCCLAGRDPK